ncbi:MAG: hypothetical protein QM682_05460 [Paracoccus sp. (in: a-proteobacteria)]|uniref:hypothetical protein n=1 Tax=Paracoccus sp. TaxID=267 RepID=UPI0039E27C73
MKKILLLLLPVLAFIGGAVGGDMLKPGEAAEPIPHAEGAPADAAHGAETGHDATDESSAASFRFPNQFFVPILRNGATLGVMVLTLSLAIPSDLTADIEAKEAVLRDALLNALLIEANTGGFDGNFTSEPSLSRLRASLLTAAKRAGDARISRVLIEDIARQDQ